MNCIIKSNEERICKADIGGTKDSMGVITQKFTPLEGYTSIERLIQEYSHVISELTIFEVKSDPKYLELKSRVNSLELSAFTEEGEKLCFAYIELRDYSDLLGNEGYEVYFYQ